MRLLHLGPDYVGGGAPARARRGVRCRRPRIHERQYLPLRRLPEHRPGHPAGAARARRELTMQVFDLVQVTDAPAAIAAGAASPTAQQGASVRFLAGGTTLVALMKLNVEYPDR